MRGSRAFVYSKRLIGSVATEKPSRYRYQHCEEEEWEWLGIMGMSSFAGSMIGCGVGMYDGLQHKDFEHRVARPIGGLAMGTIGGAIPPLGIYWLYVYYKSQKERHD